MSFDMIKLIARIFIILVTFFQVSIIPVLASPVVLDQSHHTGISAAYTYDGVESSVGTENGHTNGLSRVLSEKEVRSYNEVLGYGSSVAAKSSTSLVTKYPANAAISGTAERVFLRPGQVIDRYHLKHHSLIQ